jgi:sugar/nucleoside kinase (ribokinase family)
MASVLILGTVALDSVKTPFGSLKAGLGGSASFASTACSFFSPSSIVSIIGEDFPKEHLDFLRSRKVSLEGVQKKGKSFRWEGSYEYDMNEAKTIKTELNSLLDIKAVVPKEHQNATHVFLANIDPTIQLGIVKQMKKPTLIVMDTMNFWITSKKKEVLRTMEEADIVVMNDGEARQLFDTVNLSVAAKKALSVGPTAVIIKKGEHGALLFTKDKHFNAPGYPLEVVKDPTGCGDSFGGAFIGYLAREGKHDEKTLRKAVVYGSVVASFNAEDFSLNRMRTLKMAEIEKRYGEMKEIREF